jgi:hypothetical protein
LRFYLGMSDVVKRCRQEVEDWGFTRRVQRDEMIMVRTPARYPPPYAPAPHQHTPASVPNSTAAPPPPPPPLFGGLYAAQPPPPPPQQQQQSGPGWFFWQQRR